MVTYKDILACFLTRMEVLTENFIFQRSILKSGALRLDQRMAHVQLTFH